METGATVFCSQCGQAFRPSEVVTLAGAVVCASCKPMVLRKLQEGAPAAATLVYKGFWIRLLAKLLDWVFLDIILYPLSLVLVVPFVRQVAARPGQAPSPQALYAMLSTIALFELGAMALLVAYNTLMLGRFGTTMGKMVIGAKVVTPAGAPITYAQALGRSLMELVSGFMLLIGYIIAAFDDQKRALHDRVAGTVVVQRTGQ